MKTLNYIEKSGAGFWSRVGDIAVIYVRDPGPTEAMWENARRIRDFFHSHEEIEIDKISMHLVVKVKL